MTRRRLLKRAGMAGAAVILGGAIVIDRTGESPDDSDIAFLPGFNDNFVEYSHSDLGNRTMARVSSCGGRCVRFGIDWGTVQADGPEHYDWSNYDPLFLQVLVHGLELMPTITGCPDWADPVTTTKGISGHMPRVPPSYNRSCDPRHDGDFGRFADATLRHFDAFSKDRDWPRAISAVEILNEPNIWNIGEMPPQRLAELAGAAADQVAASEADGAYSGPMRVISGGLSSLAGLAERDRPGQLVHAPWEDYLGELVAGGTGFDVGFHSYEISKPPAGILTIPEENPEDPSGRARQFAEWQAAGIVERIDVATSIASTDIWVTETGASSASTWSQDIFTPSYRAANGQAIQALALSRIAGALKSRDRVRSMLVHRLYSDDTAEPPPDHDSDSPHYQDGVFQAIDGPPKTAVAALAEAWN